MDESKEHRGWYQHRALPHFDSPERVQFVTFRLADSLPSYVARSDETSAEVRRRLKGELDEGRGACWLAKPEIADIVQGTLLSFHLQRYRMWAWCIMPNHVHCLFEPDQGQLLSDIVRSWKVHSAIRANRLLQRSGPFWQRDFFDRYMRYEEQFTNTLNYIERNPVSAGLCGNVWEWRWSSAWGRR
ncbi:REP-associated tyrosine transposase [Labrys okinawensis]|uniref:REP-associated tyrosine transposase n=1 Tax=Labrys okinawensis TaxID=346911 RepID=UPI0039BD2B8E